MQLGGYIVGMLPVLAESSAACLVLAALLAPAQAGCVARPEPYKLQSDTVHWSITIVAGGQCIQGVRGRTVLIEGLEVVEQPKSGHLTLVGPGFRYSADAEPGNDSFELSVTGTSVRMHGTSLIMVDVDVQ